MTVCSTKNQQIQVIHALNESLDLNFKGYASRIYEVQTVFARWKNKAVVVTACNALWLTNFNNHSHNKKLIDLINTYTKQKPWLYSWMLCTQNNFILNTGLSFITKANEMSTCQQTTKWSHRVTSTKLKATLVARLNGCVRRSRVVTEPVQTLQFNLMCHAQGVALKLSWVVIDRCSSANTPLGWMLLMCSWNLPSWSLPWG
jgi:hypothetical protein